ncbi:MAG: NTP transferase domain-containing protein, partial [Chloroflexota bacterium]
MKITTILLAAGKGMRMKSKLPKVLHPLVGRPMVWHALQAIQDFTDEAPVLVVGYQGDEVIAAVGDAAQFVEQTEQLGTGHAVMQTTETLRGKTTLVLVTYGDMPLLTSETFHQIVETQKTNAGPITMLSMINENPRGFGRVVRDSSRLVKAIIEEVDCTPEQLEIKELNVGVYCFEANWLWETLSKIPLSEKGEYYLTDMVGLANNAGLPVKSVVLADAREGMGINSRVHLAEANKIMQQRINQHWMLAG